MTVVDTTKVKLCHHGNHWKSFSEFGKDRHSKDGHRASCKQCNVIMNHESMQRRMKLQTVETTSPRFDVILSRMSEMCLAELVKFGEQLKEDVADLRTAESILDNEISVVLGAAGSENMTDRVSSLLGVK